MSHIIPPPPLQAAQTSRADPGTSEQRWKAVRTCIEKADKAAEKARDWQITAGQHLRALKAEHDAGGGTWAEWESLVKEKAGIGKSRASELMAIADGTKTLERVRADTAERTAKTKARLKLSASSGENADEPEKRQDRAIGMVHADAGKAAAPSKAEPPPTSSERSWRVELTTDDGRRLVNGARF